VAVLHLTVLHPTQNVKLFILEKRTVAVKKRAINYILVLVYVIMFIVTLIDLARLYKVNGSCKAFMIAIPSHSKISVVAAPRRCRYVALHKDTRSVQSVREVRKVNTLHFPVHSVLPRHTTLLHVPLHYHLQPTVGLSLSSVITQVAY